MVVRRHRAIASATLASFLLLLTAAACASAGGKGKSSSTTAAAEIGGSWTPAERARIAQAQPHVRDAARRYGVDPNLINAVIWVESKFDPKARGPGGAAGYMQLMPSTAKGLAKQMGETSRPYNPDFNVRAGTYYLSAMLGKFDGSERLAIAAYNAGPGNVKKWQKAGTGLPKTSQRYVASVMEAKARFYGR